MVRALARGMAIKLLDVEGTPAIPATGSPCQDFLTVNHPVFPFGTPAEYVKFFDIRAKPRVISELVAAAWLALFHRRSRKIVTGLLSDVILPATPVAGDLLAAAWLALFHPRHAMIATEDPARSRRKPTGDVLERLALLARSLGNDRWSRRKILACAPFRSDGAAERSKGKPNDYLTQTLSRYLKTQEAVFEFRVQPQTDPVAMPVEDTSVEWDEDGFAADPCSNTHDRCPGPRFARGACIGRRMRDDAVLALECPG